MKSILFVTGNKRKIGEARLGCKPFSIMIKPIKLNIEEIQFNNPKDISKYKAENAYSLVKKPIVISDTFWNIPALNGFPGGYMKDVANWFTSSDFVNLLSGHKNKEISFTESIVYKDSSKTKTFSKTYYGTIVEKPRGTGNSIENIAEFEGFTLGERRKQKKFSHKPKDYIWADFAKWYSSQKLDN